MRYSKSLLKDKEIGLKLYQNSIEKAKELLRDIFGVDFSEKDSRIVRMSEDPETKVFEVEFNIDGRIIFATQSYESGVDDLIQEILIISEGSEESVPLVNLPLYYEGAVSHVMDLLEGKYDLNFTPLDPTEKDDNIKIIHNHPDEHTVEVIFKHEDHEAFFTATFLFVDNGESSLIVKQDKQHAIYLD